MLNTNRDKLIIQSVLGEISSPTFGVSPYRISPDGEPQVLPSVGGITYNVRIGDPAGGWQADHVEPGVSIKNMEKGEGQYSPNRGLNVLACIGNRAKVISGEAKGEKGIVTGKHGGIEHVLVDFEPETLEKLIIGDKLQVKTFGTGLKLVDYPSITVMNIDPDLLVRLEINQQEGKLEVPVTHLIPAQLMGAGLGSSHTYSGDYDIQLFDEKSVQEHGLEDLKLGDFVAISDADNTFGRVYRPGAVTVGVVVHTACVVSGHGPGVTTIMTSKEGNIIPVVQEDANLIKYIGG